MKGYSLARRLPDCEVLERAQERQDPRGLKYIRSCDRVCRERIAFSMNRMQRLQQTREDILHEADLRLGRSPSVDSERTDGINFPDRAGESEIKQLRFD